MKKGQNILSELKAGKFELFFVLKTTVCSYKH